MTEPSAAIEFEAETEAVVAMETELLFAGDAGRGEISVVTRDFTGRLHGSITYDLRARNFHSC